MTTENQVATGAETQNLAPETTQPEVVIPDSTGSEALEGGEPEAQPEKTAEQKELERLRRQITKRDRTQGKLHQELEEARAALARQQPTPTPSSDPADPTRVETEARALAREIARAERFNERCNEIAAEGKKTFKADWDEALKSVAAEVALFDNDRPTPLMEVILESDAPAKLLHHLGKNPDLAAELDGLSPTQAARRLDRIEREMTAAPKTSGAPKPLTPVTARASPSAMPSDDDDTETWLAKERKRLAAKQL